MLNKDKRGIFALESVQAFFAIILGIALLAYVIIVVMGTLNQTTILPSSAGNLVVNETGLRLNTSHPSTLALSTVTGFSGPTITAIWADWNQTLHGGSLSNLSTGYNVTILLANASVNAVTGVLSNASTALGNVSVSYTYTRNTGAQDNANAVLGNTSAGITGFFGNITPVYAILAVLVIILVLVVLVRVVQAPAQNGSAPQL